MKQFATAFFLLTATLPIFSQVQNDAVLGALQAEMARSKSDLKLLNEKPPYYIEYSLTDQESFIADSSMGAPRTELHLRVRTLRAMVLVGDHKRDNSLQFSAGAVEIAPLDNDPEALRQQIWLATDKAYKAALQQYAAKQVMLKQFQQEQPLEDFSTEKPLTEIGATVKLDDVSRWPADLNAVTMIARQHPNVLSSTAAMRAFAVNRYFVNSEGSATRKGQIVYNLQTVATAQAADGMRFDQGKAYVIVADSELPSREKLLGDYSQVIERVEALRNAPMVEEQYRGPVLFSADATTTLFAALVSPNVEAKKPRPGETGRTLGAFASSYKSRVLPQFVDVRDDPTRQTAAGRSLAGYYLVDDDAVKAQAVNVIEKGILKTFLMSRQPILNLPNSNGHGRSGAFQRASSETGNLFISSSAPVKTADLKQQFLEACKARGAEYCYRVDSLGGRLAPDLLYRVYTKDGHEELVRGAAFEQLDTRELRNGITAMGDDQTVSNFYDQFGYSVIAPSALFEELQIKRSPLGNQKLPDYPAPAMN